jgi:hypothetical protein
MVGFSFNSFIGFSTQDKSSGIENLKPKDFAEINPTEPFRLGKQVT